MITGKFGIELECFNVDMMTVVNTLTMHGINAVRNGYSGREYSVWQVKSDCSIQGSNGFEVVSPVLEGEAGIEQVRKVCNLLVAMGAKVNKSCGFHVHHNATNWGINKFRNLFKRFVKFEAALDSVQPESRRADNNRYCASVITSFQKIDNCRTVRDLSALYGHSRYYKLNLQSFFRMGSVEFRHHAGTVEADKVEQYIRLTFAMVADAEDHTAIKPLKAGTSNREALNLMLAGMVRRNRISKDTVKFYQQRADKFTAEVAA